MIYIDKLFRSPAFRHELWCHMTADTLTELHAFAQHIGLKRSWFQPRPPASTPHYDLTPGKRAQAIKNGAREVATLELIKIWRKNKDRHG